MSTQRRRVLENSGLISDGIYIEGLNGKFYTVDNWHGGNDANSVVVASGDVKFRIALTQAPSYMTMGMVDSAPLNDYMTALDYDAALSDYDGAGNTAKIIQSEYCSGTTYAAGYCNAFTFPDGKTKGYLPALGQLHLVCANSEALNTALSVCGGTVIPTESWSWSSTFSGIDISHSNRFCWMLGWGDCTLYQHSKYCGLSTCQTIVRPFADIS